MATPGTRIEFTPLPKQFEVYSYLADNTTNEVLYGGSIAFGKSRIACYGVILMCLTFPGTGYLIGRNQLKLIMTTTLNSFFDITKDWNTLEQETKATNTLSSTSKWKTGKNLKQSFGRVFFDVNRAELKKEEKRFQQLFPNIFGFIRELKNEDYKNLAIKLQQLESNVIVDECISRIRTERSDILVSSIEDSIVSTTEYGIRRGS